MQRLYDVHGFDTLLVSYTASELPDPGAGTQELIMHEVFCCKKRTVRYCDAAGDERAIICWVTPARGTRREPYKVVSRLRIGNIVYEARVPKV